LCVQALRNIDINESSSTPQNIPCANLSMRCGNSRYNSMALAQKDQQSDGWAELQHHGDRCSQLMHDQPLHCGQPMRPPHDLVSLLQPSAIS
jgi:hypothetical protein